MVCKLCGGTTVLDTKELMNEHEKLVREKMEEYKDYSCRDLVDIIVTSIMSFDQMAARRILVERGHRDV